MWAPWRAAVLLLSSLVLTPPISAGAAPSGSQGKSALRLPRGTADDPGTGLRGDYFNDRNLGDKVLQRVDPAVDFDWIDGSPDPAVFPDNFSVRWTGFVKPEFSEPYTFFITVDDGVRLWVGGQLVIDAWIDQPPTV